MLNSSPCKSLMRNWLVRFHFCLFAAMTVGFLSATHASPEMEQCIERPALLATEVDRPAIQARVEDPRYLSALNALKSDTSRLRNFLDGAKGDKLVSARKEVRNQWAYFHGWLRSAALLAWLEKNEETISTAKEGLGFWMASFSDEERKQKFSGWGSSSIAIAYDFLWPFLSAEERKSAVETFAIELGEPTRKLMAKEWFALGENPSGRLVGGANWMALFAANLGMTLLAVEGTPAFDPEMLGQCVQLAKGFLNEAISTDGALFEGMEYASGFGTKDLGFFLLALKRRGIDLAEGSNLQQLPFWVAQESMPWGYESFDHNKSPGRLTPGSLVTWLAKEQGGLGLWLYESAIMESAGGTADPVMALLNGLPTDIPQKDLRAELPRSHWFSSRGLVFSRTGWGPDDTLFFFGTNPVGAGHTHADQGQFLLASHGAYLIADNWASNYTSDFHNVILIDEKGQPQVESRVDAFVREVILGEGATFIDSDLSLSYSRVLVGELNGPWALKDHLPTRQADRKMLFVEGASGPVLVVRDSFDVDDKRHTFDWQLHTPGNNRLDFGKRTFQFEEKFGGPYVFTSQPGKVVDFHLRALPKGEFRCWMLFRSIPSPAFWCANSIAVNGQPVSPTSVGFGRGYHREGWTWWEIKPREGKAFPHNGGPLTVQVRSNSGAEIAAFVATTDLNWIPDSLPADEGDFAVGLAKDATGPQDKLWSRGSHSAARLDGIFLGDRPVTLRSAVSGKPVEKYPARQRLTARFVGTSAEILAVMAPSNSDAPSRITMAPDSAERVSIVESATGKDIVLFPQGKSFTFNDVSFTGDFSILSYDKHGTLKKFFAVGATSLRAGDKLLLSSDALSTVLNDGSAVHVSAPGGTKLGIDGLAATRLFINGGDARQIENTASIQITATAPAGPWISEVSEDGLTVSFTGAGETTPSAHAPKAIRVLVNGVERFFHRKGDDVFPVIHEGTVTFPPEAKLLKEAFGEVGLSEAAGQNFPRVPSEAWSVFGPLPLPEGSNDVPTSPDAVNQRLTEDPLRVDGASSPGALLDELRQAKVSVIPNKIPAHAERTVDFKETLDIARGRVCYAATIIDAQETGNLLLGLQCDHWGRVFINGERVKVIPRRLLADLDGADFMGGSKGIAVLPLQKGRDNLLLVKTQGGGGSNSFQAIYFTPGKVTFHPLHAGRD